MGRRYPSFVTIKKTDRGWFVLYASYDSQEYGYTYRSDMSGPHDVEIKAMEKAVPYARKLGWPFLRREPDYTKITTFWLGADAGVYDRS